MRRCVLPFLAFVLLSGCEAVESVSPAPAGPLLSAGSSRFNEKMEFSGTTVNPCEPAEPIAFSGRLHLTGKSEPTTDGYVAKFHVNTQGLSGVGLHTGLGYQIIVVSKSRVEVTYTPSASDSEVTEKTKVVSQGSNDNFAMTLVFTTHFDPDNGLSVKYARNEQSCK